LNLPQVPAYGAGPFAGASVAAVLCLLCLTIYIIYPRYRPLRSLSLFYLALFAYFVGFFIYVFQASTASILWGYRLMLIGLAWLPVSWVWLTLSLRGEEPGWAAYTILLWATLISLVVLAVNHPLVLGEPLITLERAGVLRPSSLVVRPFIYAVDLMVIVFYIYAYWWRWRPASGLPAYLKALVAGLVLWFMGGLHDAAYSLAISFTLDQPILWLASIWLSLWLGAATALRWREMDRELATYRGQLEELVEERTSELQAEVVVRQRAESALAQLAAGVAHNFNNVLMAIVGNAQAAHAKLQNPAPSPDPARAYLDNIIEAVRGGRDVVNRLYRYVDKSGGVEPRREVVDLVEMLGSFISMVRRMWPEVAKGSLRVEVSLEPEIYVEGVWGELLEVFLNIVKNSVEACAGQGRLAINSRREDQWAVIDFIDDGQGAEQETLAHFFDPFFTTKGVGGQGLGLAVSQGIIKSHGGMVSAFSRPGQGATITVRLPLTKRRPQVPLLPPEGGETKDTMVMVVEDESLVAMGIGAVLEQGGHQVVSTATLAQGMAAMEEQMPDVVLCDLGLPDQTGWKVVERLRSQGAKLGQPGLPIIVLTGWSASQLGPDEDRPAIEGLLQKPVVRTELLSTVGAVLANLSQDSPPGSPPDSRHD
jgi:signal transduction histidine kinase/CheY-like chemotaxis protein